MRWGVLLVWLAASSVAAEELAPKRIAVVVGARAAALGRSKLQFAHDDAEAVARALREVARFRDDDVRVLLEPRPQEILAALDRARAEAMAQPNGAMLLFYYSGHADERALYPSGQRLPFTDLHGRLEAGPAIRIGIIDACRGGGWTGAKGLTAAEPFEVHLPLSMESEGSVLLSSSSGQENAHEAEAIGGSIFTHHFVAGLRGAADANSDGEVSVAEVFSYARDLTVRDSALLTSTPQHPSFRFNLRGRDDLPLSRAASSPLRVSIHQTRGPLVILDRNSGRNVLELPAGERRVEVALPPGRYLALRRSDGQTHAREFRLAGTEQFALHESTLVHSPQLASMAKGGRSTPRYTLTVEPLVFSAGAVNLEFERAMNEHFTLYAGPGMRIPVSPGAIWSAQLNLGMRYFFFGEAPSGLFAGAQVNPVLTFAPDETRPTVALSLQAGYSLILWERLVFSMSAGPQYLTPLWQTAKGSRVAGGMNARLRFSVGASF